MNVMPLAPLTALDDFRFHNACVSKPLAEVQQLHLDGANPYTITEDGITPLLAAARANRDRTVAKWLAGLGGYSLAHVDNFGHGLVRACAGWGDMEMLAQAIDAGSPEDLDFVMVIALIACQTEAIEFLLHRGADPNRQDDIGRTVLHHVMSPDIGFDAFMRAGADVNVQDKGGYTPLMLAAVTGNLRLVSRLIGEGADLEIRIKSRDTPLIAAAKRQHIEIVAALIDAGANIKAVNARRSTILKLAKTRPKLKMLLQSLQARERLRLAAEEGRSLRSTDETSLMT